MLNEKMQDALNDQINAEMYSGYLYLSMAAWFDSINLSGMAQWMRYQTVEEENHAIKFFNYVAERGGDVKLQAINAPPTEWDSPLAAFEDAYKHEQYITGRINDLVDLARELKDHATESFLNWYVDEQVEEEATADENVESLRLVKDNPGGLFMIDRELKSRPAPAVLLAGQVAEEE